MHQIHFHFFGGKRRSFFQTFFYEEIFFSTCFSPAARRIDEKLTWATHFIFHRKKSRTKDQFPLTTIWIVILIAIVVIDSVYKLIKLFSNFSSINSTFRFKYTKGYSSDGKISLNLSNKWNWKTVSSILSSNSVAFASFFLSSRKSLIKLLLS